MVVSLQMLDKKQAAEDLRIGQEIANRYSQY